MRKIYYQFLWYRYACLSASILICYGITSLHAATSMPLYASSSKKGITNSLTANTSTSPLGFEANRGQYDGSEYFRLKGKDMTIIFRQGIISFYVTKKGEDKLLKGHHWQLKLSNERLIPSGKQIQSTATNHIGEQQNTKSVYYKQVRYKSRTGKQELVFYFNKKGQLAYDLILASDVNPSLCFYKIEGLEHISITDSAALALLTSLETDHYSTPKPYQEKESKTNIISSNHCIEEDKIFFETEESINN